MLSQFTSQDDTGGSSPCDKPAVLIEHVTLDVAQVPSAVHDACFRMQCCQTGRKKLMFKPVVVKDSSGASVDTKAMPIAASVRSQSTPPCSVPMGLACWGLESRDATARPRAISSM